MPRTHKRAMPLIVFEGLDGSGKSSLMNALEVDLLRQNWRVVRTREPGGTPLGDELRNMILRTEGPAPTARTELLLYEASRAQHVDEVIAPALRQNHWVLCDRFSASSIAFQAGGRKISQEWVESLNEFATAGVLADLTVLLDLSVEESRRRRQVRESGRGAQEDRIESEADTFHTRVRESFLEQSRVAANWLVLDAALSPDILLEKLLQHLQKANWLGHGRQQK